MQEISVFKNKFKSLILQEIMTIVKTATNQHVGITTEKQSTQWVFLSHNENATKSKDGGGGGGNPFQIFYNIMASKTQTS